MADDLRSMMLEAGVEKELGFTPEEYAERIGPVARVPRWRLRTST